MLCTAGLYSTTLLQQLTPKVSHCQISFLRTAAPVLSIALLLCSRGSPAFWTPWTPAGVAHYSDLLILAHHEAISQAGDLTVVSPPYCPPAGVLQPARSDLDIHPRELPSLPFLYSIASCVFLPPSDPRVRHQDIVLLAEVSGLPSSPLWLSLLLPILASDPPLHRSHQASHACAVVLILKQSDTARVYGEPGSFSKPTQPAITASWP